ncbi:PBSX family phage terminase large subunit [Enterobacter cancerogenus]
MTIISRPSLNPALKNFWMTKARNKVLYGGRASSKSWDAAGFSIYLANKYRIRVLCVRQIQNKIEESVYALLKIQIERFGLQSRFRILKNKIINKVTGSEFIFYGLNRHVDEIKSLESIDILWCEEAHGLTAAQWEVLEPTFRKEGSECWFIFNPGMIQDFVWQNFVVNPPPSTLVRKINFDENPFLSNTAMEVIRAAKMRDPDNFKYVYLGVPRANDDSSVIKMSWILAATDAHIKLGFKPSGKKRLGFDVADSGDDKCANVYSHGSVISWADEWQAGEDELMKSCARTWKAARDRHAQVTYDSIGVGAGSGSKFAEINAASDGWKVEYQKFNAGGGVWEPDEFYMDDITNADMFANLKAQTWWGVADRFRNTYDAVKNKRRDFYRDDQLISIDSSTPHYQKLITELCTPKRDFDANGRVKVESKPDMAKRGIKSPNIADAGIMCFSPIIVPDWSGWG